MSVIETDHIESAQGPIKSRVFMDQLMGNNKLNSVHIREDVHKSNEIVKVEPSEFNLRDYCECFGMNEQ